MLSVRPVAGRTMTLVASAFLGFDGAAVATFGVWTRRPVVAIIGLCLFVSSGLVLLYWRWYQHQLREIAQIRAALREDERVLRELLDG
jgi:protein-S-isoprenylcysteine O-methyltransferase Ste14